MEQVHIMSCGQEEFDLRQKLPELEAYAKSKMDEVNNWYKSDDGRERNRLDRKSKAHKKNPQLRSPLTTEENARSVHLESVRSKLVAEREDAKNVKTAA